MLISVQHNFLFVRIPKTAGISVMAAFRPHAISRPRTLLRRILSKTPLREQLEYAKPPKHATAAWARRKFGNEAYNSLTSFAVVRDPYDRAISYYEFMRQHPGHHWHYKVRDLSFDQFLQLIVRKSNRRISRQTDFLVDDKGAIIVDRLLRFETLDRDVQALWTELGLPGQCAMPHRNASSRRPKDDYLQAGATRDLINELYDRDFVTLGYER